MQDVEVTKNLGSDGFGNGAAKKGKLARIGRKRAPGRIIAVDFSCAATAEQRMVNDEMPYFRITTGFTQVVELQRLYATAEVDHQCLF